MLNTRLGRFLHFVLGCALVATALVFLWMHQAKATVQVPTVDPKQAGETYEKRMQATDELLQYGRLDL